ncbi:NADH-quinone oxidoreductase subunit C [Novimethylophilus kurashikiensis]|uniref:NADH-quinone oxidoreductase subunit C n=1 Tax=Novimethylophilus kurashikiensis TaxID=1825523 RepID=A0A2R5F757_9PROT|nr:NADH-quinone oxidoreductase subunit C [Novimethylophilus kurashikiensis]GBG14056.1 NADH-quinone oxidoreductase subunit C [Novimethylophilus kurashikiensis]
MSPRLEKLAESLKSALGDKLLQLSEHVGELTAEINGVDAIAVCTILRDGQGLQFEQLIDLCGVDYSDYKEGLWEGRRFAVVYHLLSVALNQRVRVKAFIADDEFPLIASMINVWPVANWFEREAFDLYGIMFDGHPDLRRLLTDYGFIGHPFRKDFPVIGNVEMRYDPDQQRVVYQPVSIELRNNVPRMIREEGFHRG